MEQVKILLQRIENATKNIESKKQTNITSAVTSDGASDEVKALNKRNQELEQILAETITTMNNYIQTIEQITKKTHTQNKNNQS